ncbi:MAG: hypothetical protein OEM38_11915 [Gammaproteobacteria bacterium]|nr:hypothetical protein [Gammaproteobacteria bacterium]
MSGHTGRNNASINKTELTAELVGAKSTTVREELLYNPSYSTLNLDSAVGSRFLAQALDAPSECLTL